MAQQERARFTPFPCDQSDSSLEFDLTTTLEPKWVPMIKCAADFPAEIFEAALSQLIHHPEYNSTLILRSETVSETVEPQTSLSELPVISGFVAVRDVHRKLLPRRPGRDKAVEQHCTLYAPQKVEKHEEYSAVSILVLTPIVPDGESLPYYHPAVKHLAFSYLSTTTPPTLRLDIVPLPETPTDLNSRLYRTCLALLETLHRYGWGALTSYQKRVQHDRLVAREPYQDLYLIMRERHKHLVDTWVEATDPLKHVFEDIGIATYLMLLWKDTYSMQTDVKALTVGEGAREWDSWPRPSGGFLDLGCGNGLLVHILASEGYVGHGIDLRARQSWVTYPPSTQGRLQVHALDPTALPSSTEALNQGTSSIPAGCFIIANHADELTPWTPVLATIHRASGFLSLPCCAWNFDMRFQRSTRNDPFGFLFQDVSCFSEETFSEPAFVEELALGGDGSHTSGYSAYRIWLAKLNIACGWKVECDTLRIPSTRNWAIVGRARLSDKGYTDRMETLLRVVQDRGLFKTRKPEGKAGEH